MMRSKELLVALLVGAQKLQTELAAARAGRDQNLRVRVWDGTDGSWGPSVDISSGNVGPGKGPSVRWSCITANTLQWSRKEFDGQIE